MHHFYEKESIEAKISIPLETKMPKTIKLLITICTYENLELLCPVQNNIFSKEANVAWGLDRPGELFECC